MAPKTSPILAPTWATLTGRTNALGDVVDLRGGIEDNIRVNARALTTTNTGACSPPLALRAIGTRIAAERGAFHPFLRQRDTGYVGYAT